MIIFPMTMAQIEVSNHLHVPSTTIHYFHGVRQLGKAAAIWEIIKTMAFDCPLYRKYESPNEDLIKNESYEDSGIIEIEI
jgi:hypothetical protein